MPPKNSRPSAPPALSDENAPLIVAIPSSPLETKKPDIVEYPRDNYIRTYEEEPQKPTGPPSQTLQKISFFSEIVIYLGLSFCLAATIIHYVYLFPLATRDKARDFKYPSALVISLHSIGFAFFSIAAAFRITQLKSKNIAIWWVAYLGGLTSLMQLGVVAYWHDDFLRVLIEGKLEVGAAYAGLYAVTIISVGLLNPALAIIDMYGPEVKKARFYRLLMVTGTFSAQLALIITVHSVIVHVGFGVFLLGVSLMLIGYLSGLYHAKKRRETYYGDQDTVDNL